jgi:hypothetical protein
MNLYVASGIAKLGITGLTIAVWPWLLTCWCFRRRDLLTGLVAFPAAVPRNEITVARRFPDTVITEIGMNIRTSTLR